MSHRMLHRLLVVFVVFSAACIDDVGDGLGYHACEVSQSSGWSGYGLALHHQEPKQCPVTFRYRSSTFETGGWITDNGTRNFTFAELVVRNSDNVQVKWTANSFYESVDQKWETNLFVNYPAATGAAGVSGFDRSIFRMTQWVSGQSGTLPSAEIKISYRSDMTASISGNATPQPYETGTWTASISGGVGPYEYSWYRDGAYVGSGESYTASVGNSRFPLEVHVTDSQGGRTVSSFYVATQVDCTQISC
ncbi:MAG TPA: hypothetical protein VHG28_10020 [Longimicrobiaceae bacterium]|nr:hypothetical protein [Longimicrobiaceae bacterium]